jgi:archaellum component FlaG (FlaF/FlaG flagellin family)
METGKEFSALLQVLAGEQQIIQRTDQKAFTLLSILGVFMVFFIVHFPKIQMSALIFVLMMVYFTAALGTIYNLVRVIVPRVQKRKVKTTSEDVEKNEVINPTFFAGISQFKSPEEYAFYLKSIAKDEEQLYQMFASQVFALGNINLVKNENIRKSIFFFITALMSELSIIMSMAYARALPFLFPNG